jgi:hypothetical protein
VGLQTSKPLGQDAEPLVVCGHPIPLVEIDGCTEKPIDHRSKTSPICRRAR